MELTQDDVVRHVMVQRIIEAYAKYEDNKYRENRYGDSKFGKGRR